MRGNMLAGIPRATQLRARELVIPSAAAAAVSQMLATAARLGGRAYIPWSPAIGPSVFGNSDGSGGVPAVGGAVGLLLDSSGGWGVGPNRVVNSNNETAVYSLPSQTFSQLTLVRDAAPGGGFAGRLSSTTATTGVYAQRTGISAMLANRAYYITGRVFVPTGGVTTFRLFDTDDGSWFGTPIAEKDQWVTFSAYRPAKALSWTLALGDNVPQSLAVSQTAFWIDDLVVAEWQGVGELSQATGINKPLLASGAVPWAGALSNDNSRMLVNSTYALPTTTGYFACAVNLNNNSALQSLFEPTALTPTDSMVVYVSSGTAIIRRLGTADLASAPVAANTPVIIEGGISGGTAYISANGSDVTGAFAGFAAATGVSVFGRLPSAGLNGLAYGAVMMPTAAPTAAERAVIRRGFSSLAGLPI
jgi:hypothetical protein